MTRSRKSMLLVSLLVAAAVAFVKISINNRHGGVAWDPRYKTGRLLSGLRTYIDRADYLTFNQSYEERDGLLLLKIRGHPEAGYKAIHPILYLIKQAEMEWQRKLATQSRTLAQAAHTYKQKYGRAPPRGFDKWWTFAKENNVVLVDNYDQINRDILPFLGMPSEPLREWSNELISDTNNHIHRGSFTVHIINGSVAHLSGPQMNCSRAKQQQQLLQRISQFLPDMNISIYAHDGPALRVPGNLIDELEGLAMVGQTQAKDRWNTSSQSSEYTGWSTYCRPQSAYRKYYEGSHHQDLTLPSFIKDVYKANDFCAHPENVPLHSVTHNHALPPPATRLWPLFSQCKMSVHADMTVTPLEQYGKGNGRDVLWSDKPYNKILWRGSTTGPSHDRVTNWRKSQRIRLALLANSVSQNPNARVYTTASDNVTLAAYTPDLSPLNKRLFDVLLAGGPKQCSVSDGTCEIMKRILPFAESSMSEEQGNLYKYVLDVNGNGWSGRFQRLLGSNAAVLKSTAFTEWWGDRIQPWVHFIPVEIDYSDLHSIASFFIGDDVSLGHDALGQQIGQAGKSWAAKHWRFADMEAYMLRLYLEYARVMSRDADNPSSMDYDAAR